MVDTPVLSIAYEETGDPRGVPIILLHGFPDDVHAFDDVVPPLVKWGNPDFGPYTWPLGAARNFGVGATIVSLPPSNAHAGLMAWAALAHETAGRTPDAIAGYAQRAGLTFPIAVDERTVIASNYRTLGIPTHYFIGADGRIRETRIGALPKADMDRLAADLVAKP